MEASGEQEALDRKLRDLFESVSLLLQSDLVRCMDAETLGLLARMRDVVQDWLQGDSAQTREQMLTTISSLTLSLRRDRTILIDESNRTLH